MSNCDRVIEVEPSERRQDGFPVMSFDFRGRFSEQHQIQRTCIIDIG
jgi:hypothetical protein